jgi:hypothetical protein
MLRDMVSNRDQETTMSDATLTDPNAPAPAPATANDAPC